MTIMQEGAKFDSHPQSASNPPRCWVLQQRLGSSARQSGYHLSPCMLPSRAALLLDLERSGGTGAPRSQAPSHRMPRSPGSHAADLLVCSPSDDDLGGRACCSSVSDWEPSPGMSLEY